MTQRAAPESYALKAVTVHRDGDRRSVIVTEIAGDDGRTVFAQATEPLDADPTEDLTNAMRDAGTVLAALVTATRPRHWLSSGKHILTLHDGSDEPCGITVIDAEKWTVSVPGGRTPEGNPDGAIEIAYLAATAPTTGGQAEPPYAITQSVYGQLTSQRVLRPIPVGDALRTHRLPMRAANAVMG